jgi:HEAT repeat protein
VTFIVDVTIEYQFNAMAKLAYKGDQLTAFLGTFYGIYLNLITFALQFFLTGIVVRRLGVGGTLQIMPVTLSIAAVVTYFVPGVYSSAGLRLLEAASRYTLNRTGMELLYLPLPAELRNRTKAFMDIFVDRMGRGLGGMVLILCTAVLTLKPTQIALVTAGFSLAWMALSMRASREYLTTVRGRLASRRLDLAEARISCDDPQTLALIEQTAAGENPRQAVYALSLLAETPEYEISPLLEKLARSQHDEVRAKVYDLARARAFAGIVAGAREELLTVGIHPAAEQAAAAYLVGLLVESAKAFLDSPNIARGHGALDALVAQPSLAPEAISENWLREAAGDPDPRKRVLVARAAGLAGAPGVAVIQELLEDSDSSVVRAACAAAGVLRNRAHVFTLTRCLTDARYRGAALAALAEFGPRVCGTLSDALADETASPALRRQIPRVLKLIPDQRSVDILAQSLGHPDPALRRAVLKALNRLRESAPKLRFDDPRIGEQIRAEIRRYCELNAALDPFRSRKNPGESAGLLARSLEERMSQTLDHLFRLLGLRYPPQEIYSAYRAVSGRRADAHSAAVEFLDSVLERDLKRLVVPLLDAPDRLLETGRTLLGIQPKNAETALRELLHSGDSWLAACAAAAGGEMKLHGLAPDLKEAARSIGDVGEVARSAAMALA